ncbi:MAG: hypothetical protein KDJ44_17270 [Rhodoblastus sp.]|nr:hypothetical protein [Rhodoblastus sp.]
MPDGKGIDWRAQYLLSLLSAAEARLRHARFLLDDVIALKAALDTLPRNATQAGTTRTTLVTICQSVHWAEYRAGLFE